METKLEVLTINGIEYVPVTNIAKINLDNYVIVRTYSAGVFAGNLVKKDGKEVTLKNARRLWYWDGAASLSQLALDGTSKPENCKFPAELPKIILTEAIEIIPCTEEAIQSIARVKVWKI